MRIDLGLRDLSWPEDEVRQTYLIPDRTVQPFYQAWKGILSR